MKSLFCSFVVLAALSATTCHAQDVVTLENFSSGVNYTDILAANNGNQNQFWYSARNDGGKTRGAPDTLDGSPAMKFHLVDRYQGGVNGLYRQFPDAVPYTGSWHVNAKVRVLENPNPVHTNGPNGLNTVNNIQVGVIINGQHPTWANLNLTTSTQVFAQPPAGYFTVEDDSGKPTVNLRTQNFEANAQDDIMIVIATDVQSGNYTANSAASWNGTYFLVDEIILENAALPVSLSAFSVE